MADESSPVVVAENDTAAAAAAADMVAAALEHEAEADVAAGGEAVTDVAGQRQAQDEDDDAKEQSPVESRKHEAAAEAAAEAAEAAADVADADITAATTAAPVALPGQSNNSHSKTSAATTQHDDDDNDAITPADDSNTPAVDRYGFLLTSRDINGTKDTKALAAKAVAQLRRRERKWVDMLRDWPHTLQHHSARVKQRCRKGIPDSLRGRAWQTMCGSDRAKKEFPGKYEELVKAADALPEDSKLQEFMYVIEKDLDRTFPHHDMFVDKAGQGQRDLRSVLRAFVMYKQDIGYCQGMGMLVGTILMHMPPEDAFWMFAMLLDRYVSGYFDSGLREVQISADMLENLIANEDPVLGAHMRKYDVVPLLYATDWFMCLFVKTLPWDSVLRIWDMFLFEGVKIFFRAALALVLQSKSELLRCNNLPDMMMILRNLPSTVLVPASLLPAMFRLKVKRSFMEALHAEAANALDLRTKKK